MRVIVFGTGKKYVQNKKYFQNMHVTALLDNDKEKQGTYIDGHIVDIPENIDNYDYDYVILASAYHNEMREQLLKLGVLSEKIIDKEHKGIWEAVRKVTCFSRADKENGNKKILLLTHGMGLTGAPIVLLELAKILVKVGYQVDLYTETRGELTSEFLQAGAAIFFFENFNFQNGEKERYFAGYDLIIVNTITLFPIVEKVKDMKIPIIWWIHEAEWIMEQYPGFAEVAYSPDLHIWAVSRISKSAFECASNLIVEKLMPFGIEEEDCSNTEDLRCCKNVVFAMVGSIEKRKAQDIFLKAAELVKNQHPNVKFWIIGNDRNPYAEELKQQYSHLSGLVWKGETEHSEVVRLYSDIDVFVCPSREETMSMVTIEAMMNNRPVIVSDNTGIADFIEHEVSGLIFESENVEELAEQMIRCIENPKLRQYMGKHGRQVYEKQFTMPRFEERVLEEISKYL